METIEQLRRLNALRDRGAISDAEYSKAKRRLLRTVPEAEETARIQPPSEKTDLRPMLVIAVLSAVVAALMSMLLLGASASIAGTIGVATLGGFTVLLYRSLSDEEEG